MYYQNYEDYMRSVLGYPISNDMYTYESSNYYYDEDSNRDCSLDEESIEDLYPDIYKKINPIVCKECDGFSEKFTKEAVENIVEKIYSNIEQDNNINVININIENNRALDKSTNENKIQNRSIENRNIDSRSIQNNVRDRLQNINRNNVIENNLRGGVVAEVENRGRKPNNPLLRDLIKILVLNRLLKRPRPNRPPRMPYPRPNARPPFIQPGGPIENYPIPPRPPMPRQEDFENYIR